MPPDEPNDEELKEQLAEDYDTPFTPAEDTGPEAPGTTTHPETDANVDIDEVYQEGIAEAANVPEPMDNSAELEEVNEIPADTDEASDREAA